MKKPAIFLLLFLLTACASIRVNYDYERGENWQAYQTYAFFPGMQTGLSDLDTRRLLAAVETTLREKGYGQSEEPDFFVNIYSDIYQDAPDSNVGVGLGGTGRNIGGGVSVGIPLNAQGLKRRITFDLIDRNRDLLVWQAVSVDAFREDESPQQREERLQAVARKVFEGFPPEK